MQQNDGRVYIGQLHYGGLAFSKYEGKPNSVAEIVGIDIHSQPGIITANQKMAAVDTSAAALDASIMVALNSTDGNTYFFSRDSGKIWKLTSGGTWSLVYTTVASSGESKCRGAIEFDGYIYWFTELKVHRIAVQDTDDWVTDTALNWATFPNGDIDYHPAIIIDNRLYVGDGASVHQIYEDVLTPDALRVLSYQRVTALGNYDNDLLIGTKVDNYINKTTIYRWNRWSDSWNYDDGIDEIGVNSFINLDNYIVINTGFKLSIYSYNGGRLEFMQPVPGDHTLSTNAIIYPNAVTVYNTMPIFGVSNLSGNPIKQGIYSFHSSVPAVYPRVFNLEYILSTGDVADVEITAILTRGIYLFVCWKKGSSYGVDKIDMSNKLNGAYFVSKVIYADTELKSTLRSLIIPYVDMPTNCSVSVYIKKQHASSWGSALELTHDATNKQYQLKNVVTDISRCQIKVVLTCSGNTAPKLETIMLAFE